MFSADGWQNCLKLKSPDLSLFGLFRRPPHLLCPVWDMWQNECIWLNTGQLLYMRAARVGGPLSIICSRTGSISISLDLYIWGESQWLAQRTVELQTGQAELPNQRRYHRDLFPWSRISLICFNVLSAETPTQLQEEQWWRNMFIIVFRNSHHWIWTPHTFNNSIGFHEL